MGSDALVSAGLWIKNMGFLLFLGMGCGRGRGKEREIYMI